MPVSDICLSSPPRKDIRVKCGGNIYDTSHHNYTIILCNQWSVKLKEILNQRIRKTYSKSEQLFVSKLVQLMVYFIYDML